MSYFLTASPGDTTWVTVWNQRKLTQYGNYDTAAVFPTGKQYRKIRLHYILGRYACPGSPQYCGSWDYTTQIYARKAGLDSVEIARVITPYASDWLSQNKKHDYIVDVSDYATVLDGSAGMRFHYSGYSWGFTITLKIEFIEGVPPMNALSVKNIYDGYFPYGNTTNSIENYLTAKTLSYSTTRAFIKNSVSGHGSDANYCSEFCDKYYQLKINGNQVSQKQLWRNDCGLNHVYPQTGTWIYDRSNWCPGAVVWPIYHDISNIVTANTAFTVDVDMETYTVSSASGGYNWVSQLVQYSAPNHSRDVSVEDIISPNNDPNYLRENPACMNPKIRIKNTGSSNVTSVVFNYGLNNNSPLTYTWTGNLNFLEETTVVLPPSASILSGTTVGIFTVNISHVNGILSDENAYNNSYRSETKPASYFPGSFVIKMFTNNSTDPNTNKNETSWKLYNESGNIILQRNLLNNNTVYLDTLKNLNPGCYKFSLDDSGCDGTSWWANQPAGNGSLRFDYIGFNSTVFYFPGDFGCNYTHYFVIANTTGISEANVMQDHISIYPNPSGGNVFLKLDLAKKQNILFRIYDLSGRELKTIELKDVHTEIISLDLGFLAEGVYYTKSLISGENEVTGKLIIQR